MALEQKIAQSSGVDAGYWKIASINSDYVGKSISVIVSGYTGKEARDAGRDPLASVQLRYNFTDDMPDITREGVYGLLKGREEFQGSKDA